MRAKDGVMTRVTLDPAKPPRGRTDWRRVDALSDEEIERAARSDPDARPPSDDELEQFQRVVDARALRRRLGMSQERFARSFHLSVGTVRDWEQGRALPDGPARVLLKLIERNPDIVLETLQTRCRLEGSRTRSSSSSDHCAKSDHYAEPRGCNPVQSWPRLSIAARSRSIANSISAAVVVRPRPIRIEPWICSSVSPSARSTGDGSWDADAQAAPVASASSGTSASRSSASIPGKVRFRLCGRRGSDGPFSRISGQRSLRPRYSRSRQGSKARGLGRQRFGGERAGLAEADAERRRQRAGP